MSFLRNAWYAAAWDDEVPAQTTFTRRILNEDILFLRGADGTVHALRNRCPHRFAPLSLGKREGDVIECPYHGLRFALDGRCVGNPHGDAAIPAAAKTQSYPLVAKNLLLWIWMGDPAAADAALIPDLPGLDPARFAIVKGYMHTATQYELITDNIMDLGHIDFLHPGLLGSEWVRRAETDVRQTGNTVYSDRRTRSEILPPMLDHIFEAGGKPVDRLLSVRWEPAALMELIVDIVPAGQPEGSWRSDRGVHLMTPETADTTHYFWSSGRDFRKDDAQLQEQILKGVRFAFEQQDKPMILAQRAAMEGEEFWELNPISLRGDAAALRARRVLQELISTEKDKE